MKSLNKLAKTKTETYFKHSSEFILKMFSPPLPNTFKFIRDIETQVFADYYRKPPRQSLPFLFPAWKTEDAYEMLRVELTANYAKN